MRTKAAVKCSAIPRAARFIEIQYGCDPVQFVGNAELADGQRLFDNRVVPFVAPARARFEALARSIRDILSQRLLLTEETYEGENGKRLYHASMRFLIGRLLANNMKNLLLPPSANRPRRICQLRPRTPHPCRPPHQALERIADVREIERLGKQLDLLVLQRNGVK